MLETNLTKLVLSADGEIQKKEFTLSARKYPLHEIREKSLEKNVRFLNLRPESYYEEMSINSATKRLEKLNEDPSLTEDPVRHLKEIERSRHWLMWHDHSGLGNRGTMLILVRELYDPAIHMTDQEFEEQNGHKVGNSL